MENNLELLRDEVAKLHALLQGSENQGLITWMQLAALRIKRVNELTTKILEGD